MSGWQSTPRSYGKVVVEKGVVTFYFGAKVADPKEYRKKAGKFGSFVLLRCHKDKHRLLGVEFMLKLLTDQGVLDFSTVDAALLIKLSRENLRGRQTREKPEDILKDGKYLGQIERHISQWKYPPLGNELQAVAA